MFVTVKRLAMFDHKTEPLLDLEGCHDDNKHHQYFTEHAMLVQSTNHRVVKVLYTLDSCTAFAVI